MTFPSKLPNKAGNQLLSGEQIAKMLNVHSKTIYRWMEKGEFPQAVRFGHQYRWREAEVNKWIEDKWNGGNDASTTGDC